MKELCVLAVDLGAGSGRGILGRFNGNRVTCAEIHRFKNEMIREQGHYYWNVETIEKNVNECVEKAYAETDGTLACVGVDAWAQDYGLLDGDGALLGKMYSYRDDRTAAARRNFLKRVSPERVFDLTGVRPGTIHTLFQLMAHGEKPGLLSRARAVLPVADLVNWSLAGTVGMNTTAANMGLLYNPFGETWCTEMIRKAGLPQHIFPELVKPGTLIGSLKRYPEVALCAVTSHDTTAAMDFVPVSEKGSFLISSGTWSVAGMSVDTPVIDPSVYASDFSNELGYGDQYFLLRNITGFWIAQELFRAWGERAPDFEEMNRAARESAFDQKIDVDWEAFGKPGDMPEKISHYFKKRGQKPPRGKADFYKSVLLGLAHKYHQVLTQLEKASNCEFEEIVVVGGGAKNDLLNRYVWEQCGLPVRRGAYESAALGNILCQLIGLRAAADKREAQGIYRNSVEM